MKVLLIVVDSFGIGYLPDAELYGDVGANTALHICEFVEEVELPNLRGMGLGHYSMLLGNPLTGLPASDNLPQHTQLCASDVPILALLKGINGRSVGIRDAFADTAQTIATFFAIAPMKNGCSLW